MCNKELKEELINVLQSKGCYTKHLPLLSANWQVDGYLIDALAIAMSDEQIQKLIDDIRETGYYGQNDIAMWALKGLLKIDPVVIVRCYDNMPILMLSYKCYIAFDETCGFVVQSRLNGRVEHRGATNILSLLNTVSATVDTYERRMSLSRIILASFMPILMKYDYGYKYFTEKHKVIVEYLEKLGNHLGIGDIQIDDLVIKCMETSYPCYDNVAIDMFEESRPNNVKGMFTRGTVVCNDADGVSRSSYALFALGYDKILLYVKPEDNSWKMYQVEVPEYFHERYNVKDIKTVYELYLNAMLAKAGIWCNEYSYVIHQKQGNNLRGIGIHTNCACDNWEGVSKAIENFVSDMHYANN